MRTSWDKYSRWLQRWWWCVILGAVAIVAASLMAIRHLPIYSDFKRMLPQNYPSVVTLDAVETRIRSTSTLLLLVGGDDWPSMRRFIDDFVAQVPLQLGDVIERTEYNAGKIRDFFDRNRYLYADLADLEEIHRRLQRQIDYEKISASPLYVELGDKPQFNIDDIESKYRKQVGRVDQYRDGYFTNDETNLAIVVMKPMVGASDAKVAEALVARVRTVVDGLRPQSYHPSLRIGFGGKYPKLITEYSTVVGDMQKTVLLCIALVGSTVLFFFRKFRMGALMMVTAAIGTLSAIAVARFAVGYLTAQTAFLGSIILGNGINYGLILMARYLEERRDRQHAPVPAMAIALRDTCRSTLVSSLTTVASFSALVFAQVRGLSQFGLIGALGMILCWSLSYTLLPALLLLSERLWPLTVHKLHPPFSHVLVPLSRLIAHSPMKILRGAAVLAGIALLVSGWYLPNSLEYDFRKLRFKTIDDVRASQPVFDFANFSGDPAERLKTWEKWAQNSADDVFGKSVSPAVILADRLSQVLPLCRAIEERSKSILVVTGEPMVESCKTLYSYVPPDQPRKLKVLAAIRGLLTGSTLQFLNAEQQIEVERFQKTADLQPLTIEQVPDAIIDGFREVDGRLGLVVYIYPRLNTNLWDGHELARFADLVRKNTLPNGDAVYGSGESVIFSDLISVIKSEGPFICVCSFALVVLLVWLMFRNKDAVLAVIGTLVLGMLWLVALLPLFHVKLNFLNFVAIPIALGIGVDYGVNIYQRFVQDGAGSMPNAIRHVGGAVTLCSMTTMFGYLVLMISRNGALASFGLTGLLAELSCLLAAVIVMPAYVVWKEKTKGVVS